MNFGAQPMLRFWVLVLAYRTELELTDTLIFQSTNHKTCDLTACEYTFSEYLLTRVLVASLEKMKM